MEIDAGPPPSGRVNPDLAKDKEVELDAGALFVLKSRGTWLHCGYHLATSIVCPSLLSLPYALSLLGWPAGTVWLLLAAAVTFYSFNLLSLVLEQQANLGRRQLRFRDMGRDILGPRWGKYYLAPLQFSICYGTVVATAILGGQTLKTIYLLARPNGEMQLYQFIIIFGFVLLILAQIPSFHSLRHINLFALILCLLYCACTTIGSVYIGKSKNAPTKDYSLRGIKEDRILSAFNGISIIATIYGSGIIPEIQATIAPPIKGKMFKGLLVCYAVIVTTYFSVAFSGYWAFGNQAKPVILSNFIRKDNNGHNLLPTWFILLTNASTIAQIVAITLVYLQPTNELFEKKLGDAKSDQFSSRNVFPRLISRSLTVITATFIGAMLPFFGDIMALFGALGFIPLDFVLPAIFYNAAFKPSKRSAIYWTNVAIAVISSMLAAIGAVASVRQMVLDAKTYHLFANLQ